MYGIHLLGALSSAMFFGSYLSGCIPLAFTMSESRIRLTSIFGAGLLIGTALSVIVPEGVESLYKSETASRSAVIKRTEASASRSGLHFDDPSKNIGNAKAMEIGPLKQLEVAQEASKIDDEVIGKSDFGEHHEHIGHNLHQSVGLSLVIGFVFMLVIDQVSRSVVSRGAERSKLKWTATMGLIIHAGADGVALGSASATNQFDVQFIVFLAIMLHKAPAAFGLVSFLLLEGLERPRIRRHLLFFSLAAPITAVATFYILILIDKNSYSFEFLTGILMLFSAGTFLYVATVHVLPELMKSNERHLLLDQINESLTSTGSSTFTLKELLAVVAGAVSPVLLSLNHAS